jgi:hypothetical protein
LLCWPPRASWSRLATTYPPSRCRRKKPDDRPYRQSTTGRAPKRFRPRLSAGCRLTAQSRISRSQAALLDDYPELINDRARVKTAAAGANTGGSGRLAIICEKTVLTEERIEKTLDPAALTGLDQRRHEGPGFFC